MAFRFWGPLSRQGPVRVNADTDLREFMRIDMGK